MTEHSRKPNGARFSERLKGLLVKRGAKKRLAAAMGILPQNLTPYLKGRIPQTRELAKMADVLGVTVDWLLHGTTPTEASGIRSVPVINAAACGDWTDNTDLDYPVGIAQGYYPAKTDDPHAFYVVAEGDSMTGPYTKGKNIEPGDMLLVEPSKEVRDGDVVFARLDGKGVTIKRFFQRDDGIELRPINPDYKSILIKAGEQVAVYRISSITTKL